MLARFCSFQKKKKQSLLGDDNLLSAHKLHLGELLFFIPLFFFLFLISYATLHFLWVMLLLFLNQDLQNTSVGYDFETELSFIIASFPTLLIWKYITDFKAKTPISPTRINWIKAFIKGTKYYLCYVSLSIILELIMYLGFQILIYYGHNYQFNDQEIITLIKDLKGPLPIALSLIATCIIAPIVEEYIFRAGLYRYLKSLMNRPLAMIVNGLVFGSIHFYLIGIPDFMVFSIVQCIAYERSGSIKVPIVIHAVNNTLVITVIFLLQ